MLYKKTGFINEVNFSYSAIVIVIDIKIQFISMRGSRITTERQDCRISYHNFG